MTAEGIPIVDSPFVTVGGGLGSFAVVHALRIAGVPSSRIAILSLDSLPQDAFKRRAAAAQLTLEDPLRSPSDATMDNIWGFPGYALRRSFRERTLWPLWQVLAEPVLSEYFTPRCRELYAGMEREAHRLGWADMIALGRVECIRRCAEGGYFVLQNREDGSVPAVAYCCRYVHLATGSPGPRYVSPLPAYRDRFPACRSAVHTYDPHDHIYARLRAAPGTVILRGAGIAAAHIIERLAADRRETGQETRIVHVFRTYMDSASGPRHFRRDGGDGFFYQSFNFPKAAFGGQLKTALERLDEPARTALIAELGRTSTPRRKQWTAQLHEALRDGWYRQISGEVTAIDRAEDGRLWAEIEQPNGSRTTICADFLIDATGLENGIDNSPLLTDLVRFTGARLNALGNFDVAPSFEVLGARHDPGRVYASGMIAAGGVYGPVDSFLGLQYAALSIAGDLAQTGFCRRLGTRRSVHQWWRWMRNRAP